uniref:Uncharacterized protein n=1 Tax=Strongyloides venezuelensis TaxID=75913 RepID=A0A0K0F4J1_STRVS
MKDLVKCTVNVIKTRNRYEKNKILNKKIRKVETNKKDALKIRVIKRVKTIKEKHRRIRRPKNCVFCKMLKQSLEKKKKTSIRKKREYNSLNYEKIHEKQNEDLPYYLKSLHRLQEYRRMHEHVNRYIARVNQENENALSKIDYFVKYKFLPDKKESLNDTISKIIELFNNYITKVQKQKFLILSPRLFNLFPSCETVECKKNNLLSPTFFSFHKKDGILSLPDILKVTSLSNTEINKWINLLIDFSGAGEVLNKTINNMGKKMDEMKNVIYPKIIAMESRERVFKKFEKMLDDEQKNDYMSNGYSFLNKRQIDILFDNKLFSKENEKLTMLTFLSKDKLEEMLENSILSLAQSSEKSSLWKNENFNYSYAKNKGVRIKREGEIGNGLENENKNSTENGEGNKGPEKKEREDHLVLLRPTAFSVEIMDPYFLGLIALSPEAFTAEIFSPRAGYLELLNPQAFIASILSPTAIFARILTPGFFRTEILSPTAINTWVLSPDIFMGEVLSPKLFESRILSPQYMFLEVLSPGLLSPNVLSPDTNGIIILSPKILSPSIKSEETMVIKVLSPEILSGDSEGTKEKETKKSNDTESGKHSQTQIVNVFLKK